MDRAFKKKLEYISLNKDKLLTVIELAERLKVHPDTVRRWANSSKIRCLRHPINNYRLFYLADWVGSHEG